QPRVHGDLGRVEGAHRAGDGAGAARDVALAQLLPGSAAAAVDHLHRDHRAHVALDVRRLPGPRLLQQRAARRRPALAASRVHGDTRGRHGGGGGGQLVARLSVLRRVLPGRHAGHSGRALPGGRGGRRLGLATLLAHPPARAQARDDRDDPADVHLHAERLQHHLRDDARGPGHRHPGVRHLLLRGRLQPATLGARRHDRDLCGAAAGRRDPAGEPCLASRAQRMTGWKAATVVGLVACGLLVLVPFGWIASMSFKTYEQIQFAQSIYVPRPFTWDNYTSLWLETRFPLWLRNSAVTAVVVTLITTVISGLGGYAVA